MIDHCMPSNFSINEANPSPPSKTVNSGKSNELRIFHFICLLSRNIQQDRKTNLFKSKFDYFQHFAT